MTEVSFTLQRRAPDAGAMIGLLSWRDSRGAARSMFALEDRLILARNVNDTWDSKGQPVSYAIEDKIPKQTAIPAGRYRLATTWSVRFQEKLPEVKNVPGFTGIRIHAGNGPEDTEGCILVGQGRTRGRLIGSRMALKQLMAAIDYHERRGPVFLEVRNP